MYFVGPLIPQFWTSDDVSSSFQFELFSLREEGAAKTLLSHPS